MKKINHLFYRIVDWMAILARIVTILIVLIILADILTVNLFHYSLPWAIEFSEYLLVFLTFLGAAWLLREDGHIKLDLVLNALRKKNRIRLEIINSVIGLIISLILAVSGFIATYNLYERGVKTEAVIELPRFILIIIIPIGFTFLVYQFLAKIFKYRKQYKANEEEGS